MKTVFISGVSTGIGQAAALLLLDRGWRVYGSVRRKGDAQVLEQHAPDHFHTVLMDVTDADARQAAMDRVRADGHGLHALVNNAGIALSGPLETLPLEDFRKQFEVNVFGLIGLTQVAIPLLRETFEREQEVVRILNVSSVSGQVAMPFTAIYSASKFAVEALTDGFRRELYGTGIDVVSIAPGPVKTPIWDKAKDRRAVFDGHYAWVNEHLDDYLAATYKTAIEGKQVAKAIADSLEAGRPKALRIVMKKGWIIKLMRALPKRRVDKMAYNRLRQAKRY